MRILAVERSTMNVVVAVMLVGLLWAKNAAAEQPYVRVVPSDPTLNETNLIGGLTVILSQPYAQDVWVQLSAAPSQQSNLVFATTNALRIPMGLTNSSPVSFFVRDGTPDSEVYGIEIVPAVTNAGPAGFYTDLQSAVVYVLNQRPSVSAPEHGTVIGPIPATLPHTFECRVSDVPADMSSMIVRWRFSAGGTLVTVTGGVGTASYTYMAPGTNTVWMQAEDKDGGLSQEVTLVVIVELVPMVSILGPAGPIVEAPKSDEERDYITVRLSSAFTNAVAVALAVTPPSSAVNGALTLATNRVVFPPANIGEVQEQQVFINNLKDGTAASVSAGFTITHSVVATGAAQAFYGQNLYPANVFVMNGAPVINTPADQPLTNVVFSVVKGVPHSFFWDVTDSVADRSSMLITWDWGDGTRQSVVGTSGSTMHTYSTAGDRVVKMMAQDKDGAMDVAQFTIHVTRAQTPVPAWWLDQYPSLMSMAGGDYEIASMIDADLDGMLTWEEYVAGSSPTNRESVFQSLLTVSNAAPQVTWSPDLGDARVYTVVGTTSLVDGIWWPTNAGTRFFRVKVEMP